MGKFDGIHFLIISETYGIWQGGFRFHDESQLDAIKKALFKYDQSSDTKAASGVSLTYSSGSVCSVMAHHCYFELTTLTVVGHGLFLL